MNENDPFIPTAETSGEKPDLSKNIEEACKHFNVDECDRMDLKAYVNFDGQAEEILVDVDEIVKDFKKWFEKTVNLKRLMKRL